MRAGQLNRRIVFKSPNSVLDQYGEPSSNYVEVAWAWASIEPVRGKELTDGGVTVTSYTHTVRCRYRRDFTIKTDMRIGYGAREFEIIDVLDVDEAHREIEIQANEVIV